jgi:hypothetical protein
MRTVILIALAATLQGQAPPSTEIFLAPLTVSGGTVKVGEFANISNSPGYDNQPFFTPDGGGILFASVRNRVVSIPIEGVPPPPQQTDIFRYDLASRRVVQVTDTLESEYSPTVTPDGRGISVIRVEADGTQRLWKFTLEGKSPSLVLKDVKPVGYHAWIDDNRLALFVLGAQGKPATLQIADVRTGKAEVIASDIGRSVQRMRDTPFVSFVQRTAGPDGASRLTIRRYSPDAVSATHVSDVTPPVPGSTQPDLAWGPNGVLMMAHDDKLHRWTSNTGWEVVADLGAAGLKGASRIAISPKGDYIAVVAAGRQ